MVGRNAVNLVNALVLAHSRGIEIVRTRLAQVADPVPGVGRLRGGEPGPGEIGDEGDHGGPRRGPDHPFGEQAAPFVAAWSVYEMARRRMDPAYGKYPIYEHCMPFDVSRAYDEASGIRHPRIWTAKRDVEMWKTIA